MQKLARRCKQIVASLTAVILLTGAAMPAAAASSDQGDQLKIAVLSDTHYLSPTMIKDTQDYTDHLNSDRKMFTESAAILEEMLDTIQQDQPDVLMISGDLTKDGEKEGHEALAAQLEELKEEVPGLDIYVVPGNHDIRNSNAMNFNTQDGQAVPAGRTEPEDFKEIYGDVTFHDDSIIATYTPPEGKEAGSLSYVARPEEGYTVIAIDSARYSADNTDAGLDEHETSGAISADLEQWILSQIAAANQRGDTVIGLEHHGMVPHFTMEPDLLPMYLVNDYERLSTAFADAGMQYIFTGHMHANDIAAVTTDAGNTLYDIETGSVVTYPSPMRYVTLNRDYDDGMVTESMEVETKTGLGPITFDNPLTGQQQTIEDVSEYGRQHGFSNQMLTTTVNGFLHSYYSQIAQSGGIRSVIEGLVGDLTGMDLPFDQLIDVALPLLLPDKESGESIYYDSDQGGIIISITDPMEITLLIPTSGLKQTLNVLLDKVDHEIAHPAGLDAAIQTVVESLTGIQVAEGKSLLDYVNYIYQSHLGGEDSQQWPDWVTEATAKIEDGQLVDQVIDVLVQDVSALVNQILDNLSVEEVLGITGWNNNDGVKDFIALEGRTPLLRPMSDNTATTINLLFSALGANWPTDPEDSKIYVVPEGANPEIGYTLGEFISDINSSMLVGALVQIDIPALLDELINGAPADPEEGTEATEGLITEEIRAQLGGWLLNLVNSMGKDSNYPEDNNTTISSQWRLSDRTGLKEVIAKAEGMDLSGYTQETVDALTEALEAAKNLPANATQTQVDEAIANLQNAMDNLEKLPDQSGGDNQGTGNPGGDPGQSGGQTGDGGNQSGSGTTDNPHTGDVFPWAVVGILVLSGAVMLTRKAKAQF